MSFSAFAKLHNHVDPYLAVTIFEKKEKFLYQTLNVQMAQG